MRRSLIGLAALAVVVAGLAPLPARAGGVFTHVVAFASKTGFRGVVAWQASAPVSGVVTYGTSPSALTRSAVPLPGAPDTAQMAIFDGLTVGQTWYAQVTDRLTGERSEMVSFDAVNAYTDPRDPYTIDLVVQLDAPHLRDGAGADQGLEDIARAMSVMAERTWDAMDEYARVGKVLVTDTNLDHAANVPFVQGTACETTGGNLADILFQTSVPYDSHTWGGFAINRPCTTISLGRMGQLVVGWRDDLHTGYVATHELMHYAFNAPDLYTVAGGGPNCANQSWNGSLMHNSGGWNGSINRWRLTELDQDQTLTPCNMAGRRSTWNALRERYTRIPNRTSFRSSYADQARGNPNGEELEIWILRRLPGGSTLERFVPDHEPFPTPIQVWPLPTPATSTPRGASPR